MADFEEYSQKIWKHGEKQLYDAFMRIMCYETEEYYSVPLAFWGGEALVLIIAKNLDTDIEKDNKVYSGNALMNVGFPIAVIPGEYHGMQIHLTAV